MDIEKEREAFEVHIKSTYPMGEQLAKDYGKTLCELYSSEWQSWQAAKAQAVPNTQALHDRLLVKSIREHVESHISEISVNDLFDKGWLAAMKCIQNNIDMLEAQEPTND